MGFGRIFLFFACIYLASLGWLVLKIAYPEHCSPESLTTTTDTTGHTQSECLEPYLPKNGAIDIELRLIHRRWDKLSKPESVVSSRHCEQASVAWKKRGVWMNSTDPYNVEMALENRISSGNAIYMCIIITAANEPINQRSVLLVAQLIEPASSPTLRTSRMLLSNTSDVLPSNQTIHMLRYGHLPLVVSIVMFNNQFLKAPFGSHRLFSPYLMEEMRIVTNIDRSNPRRMYIAPTFIDDISLQRKDFKYIKAINSSDLLNETSHSHSAVIYKFNFTLEVQMSSSVHFMFKKTLREAFEFYTTALQNTDEIEELKYWLRPDQLTKFFWTQLISWVHIVLEYLAFRDDWKYFVGRKSNRGYSMSSLWMSLFNNIVVFLYLQDNGSSIVVLISVGKDVIYLAYKIWRFSNATLSSIFAMKSNHTPKVVEMQTSHDQDLSDALVVNDSETTCKATNDPLTSQFDREAINHLTFMFAPLAVGLSLFSLVKYSHSSWYSWMISSLMNYVSLFGFMSLIPQLYINYRLKSVAHLPIKAFMYKIFNTFIDDVFAFWIIKSPLKYKLMSLRDDVVFIGFIVQWWIYPVDNSRVNEYGFQYSDESTGQIQN